jgi:hypothetical protein
VSQYACGLVCHAFCVAVEEKLKDYTLLMAQLETQYNQKKLTLQVH